MSSRLRVKILFQDDKLVPPASDNGVTDCIGLLLDAATLLEDDTLDLIRCFTAELAQSLCSVVGRHCS